jgi:hypothetical protein
VAAHHDVFKLRRTPLCYSFCTGCAEGFWLLTVHPLCLSFCSPAPDQVLAAVQQAISAIDAVVAPLTASSSSSTPQASRDDSEGEAEGMVVATKGGKGRGSMYAPLKATRADAYNQAVAKINDFSPIVEGWQGRVQPKAIEQYLYKPEVRVHGVSV